jgi:hypothetical protein
LQLTNEVKYLDFFWTRDWHGRHSWKMWWIRPTGLSGPIRAHFVKPGVWNPGWCVGSTPWWSDQYWPTSPRFGGWGSDTMSVGQSSVKMQRLACLAIIQSMKMTLTAAMEVLLWLPHLHMMIEVKSQAQK